MGILDFFKNRNDSPAMKALTSDVVGGERKDSEIFKAYIPDFLYRPPYGMPRRDNTVLFKKLAQNPYIFSIIKTLCDEATTNPWDVRVKEEFQEDGEDYDEVTKKAIKFFQNPNGNDESLKHILRQPPFLLKYLIEVESSSRCLLETVHYS